VNTVLINGEALDCVSIRDRGFQYGDGLFETIAVSDGKPLLWERHVARLLRGCERLRITPPEHEQLHAEADRLCRGARKAVLKIVLTRGPSTRGYMPVPESTPTRVLELRPWPDYPSLPPGDGVDVRICRARVARNPALAGIKHLNRLEQVMARAEWQTEFAEGLMFDEQGFLVEGTASNVFLVLQGTLQTPDLSNGGVEGVMRENVMACARGLGLACEVAQLPRAALDAAEEIFLTNSLIGIWPVRRVESKYYATGGITPRLQQAIRGTHCFGDSD
jgi:4-amino-4-deoxychorismate lyase